MGLGGRPSPDPPQTLNEEEIKALIEEGVKRLEEFNANDKFWKEEIGEWFVIRERLSNGFPELVKFTEEVIKYIEGMRRWYEEHAAKELPQLIEELRKGNVTVRRGRRSLSIVVHKKYFRFMIEKTDKKSTVVKIELRKIKYISVRMPVTADKSMVLVRMGLEMTDGYKKGKYNYASMSTANKWQALLWAWTNPGWLRLRIISINLNKKGTKTELGIVTNRKSIKQLIPQIMQRLSNEELALLTWGAILGDGSLFLVKYKSSRLRIPQIRIAAKDVNKWKELERLGFKGCEKHGFLDLRYSKARRYAKMLMEIMSPRLKRLMDLLEIKKWKTLKEFLQYKTFSHLQITIHGVAFTVQIKKVDL